MSHSNHYSYQEDVEESHQTAQYCVLNSKLHEFAAIPALEGLSGLSQAIAESHTLERHDRCVLGWSIRLWLSSIRLTPGCALSTGWARGFGCVYLSASVTGEMPELGITKDSSASKLKSRGLPGVGSQKPPKPSLPAVSSSLNTVTCEQTQKAMKLWDQTCIHCGTSFQVDRA